MRRWVGATESVKKDARSEDEGGHGRGGGFHGVRVVGGCFGEYRACSLALWSLYIISGCPAIDAAVTFMK
jgi:hypothetical protein